MTGERGFAEQNWLEQMWLELESAGRAEGDLISAELDLLLAESAGPAWPGRFGWLRRLAGAATRRARYRMPVAGQPTWRSGAPWERRGAWPDSGLATARGPRSAGPRPPGEGRGPAWLWRSGAGRGFTGPAGPWRRRAGP
jgi:hypothetical protein